MLVTYLYKVIVHIYKSANMESVTISTFTAYNKIILKAIGRAQTQDPPTRFDGIHI